jgi:hypothetical protein
MLCTVNMSLSCVLGLCRRLCNGLCNGLCNRLCKEAVLRLCSYACGYADMSWMAVLICSITPRERPITADICWVNETYGEQRNANLKRVKLLGTSENVVCQGLCGTSLIWM